MASPSRPSILLVDDEEDIREMVSLSIQSVFDAEIIEASGVKEALETLDKNPEIGCIVSDFNMGDGTAKNLLESLDERSARLPFLICSSDSRASHPEIERFNIFAYIEKPLIIEPLTLALNKILKPKSKAGAEDGAASAGAPPRYCKIRTSTLLKLNLAEGDVYLKLSGDKYVRVLHGNDAFTTDDFDRYAVKRIDYLYMRAEDAGKIARKLTDDLSQMAALGRLSSSPVHQILSTSHETLHAVADKLGFTEEIEEATKASVKLALQALAREPELRKVFEAISIDPDSYISSHSTALAFLAGGLAFQLGWTSELTRHKLALAAFLHDFSLKNQALAKMRDMRDFSAHNDLFSEADLKDFVEHPIRGAALVRTMRKVPLDIDMLIEQHHEAPDGKGFPDGLRASELPPLSSLFIAAHELLDFMDTAGPNPDLQKFLDMNRSRYGSGVFKKIRAALAQALSRRTRKVS